MNVYVGVNVNVYVCPILLGTLDLTGSFRCITSGSESIKDWREQDFTG